MGPLEHSFLTSTRWLVPGLVVAPTLLLVNTADNLLLATTTHLGLIVIAIYGLSLRLAPATDDRWFSSISRPRREMFATAAAATALVTGYAALTTLASSAALRFSPSLQFLQLLSALDIAWVVAATVIGVRWRWGDIAARGAGAAMSVICVWSIWRYLKEVGFGDQGEWIVSGEALNRLVLPFDTIAAAIAIGVVLWGIRHRQATAQPNPQS